MHFDPLDLRIPEALQTDAGRTQIELAAGRLVRFDPPRPRPSAVGSAVARFDEAMERKLMTGDADDLLRVVVKDIDALQELIVERLTKGRGVANLKSSFALKQVKYKTALPIAQCL